RFLRWCQRTLNRVFWPGHQLLFQQSVAVVYCRADPCTGSDRRLCSAEDIEFYCVLCSRWHVPLQKMMLNIDEVSPNKRVYDTTPRGSKIWFSTEEKSLASIS